MPRQYTVAAMVHPPDTPVVSFLPARLAHFLFTAFVAITVLAVFVPLNPDMPNKGIDPSWISAIHEGRAESASVRRFLRLDPSWILAMNEAVARHLRFGKEIVFTFGPYASIFTEAYHPAIDRMMVFGSLLLAVAYIIALLQLMRGRPFYIGLILLLFLATFPSRDALLLSCPFIVALCALKVVNSRDFANIGSLGWPAAFAVALTSSSLGLLLLVKGSLILPVGVSAAIVWSVLGYRFPMKQVVPLLLVSIAATLGFWVLAGQSLVDIPAYVRGILSLTSGYTDAMSTSWEYWPRIIGWGFVIVYIAMSAVVCFSLLRSLRWTRQSKWALAVLCAVFLFVSFKHGFVRTDHVSIAFSSLAIIILTICFLYADRYIVGSLVMAFALVVCINFRSDPVLAEEVRQHFGIGTSRDPSRQREIVKFMARRAVATLARVTYKSTYNTYALAWDGMRERLRRQNALQDQFTAAMADIRQEYAVPPLSGTVDVYSYEEAVVLASTNKWSPRPVLQSYSAYTPMLAKLNEQHLRGTKAPDWVLIDLLALDERLPSLDDGVSWLALLDNYSFVSYDGQFVLMRKDQVISAESKMDTIYKGSSKTGATVVLPEADGIVFAEVELRPTLSGRLLATLFKPPQLNILLTLKNGETRSYRVIANMMTTGFIVSPLVTNTHEFQLMAVGNQPFLSERKVESLSITPSYGGSVFWSETYSLTLKKYHAHPTS